MKLNNFVKFIIAIVVTQLVGYIGSLFTMPAISTWYASLNKSSLNPPDWVFGVVWTLLFLLMGISIYLIWAKGFKSREARLALKVFILQLLLNLFWSVLFFGLHRPDLALWEIFALWLAILLTLLCFRRISNIAAWLLAPYLLWVTFAIYLNYSVWHLN